jgi:hypothetical protein
VLRPVELRRLDRYDDDLLTILKYRGKTNEQFTKLLLNVTLAASAFARDAGSRRLAVLDPLCGRGSFNQAIMYGFDAWGADIDGRDVEAYAMFLKRWLTDKRLKHQADFSPVRRDHRVVARRRAIGISWNTLVARRDEAAQALAGNGLEVLGEGPFAGFRHRVDQAITRDILIARKPSRPGRQRCIYLR